MDDHLQELNSRVDLLEAILLSGITWKRVVRKGKLKRKPFTNRPRHKIVYVDGRPREEHMDQDEIRRLRKQGRRLARRVKASPSAKRRRKLSWTRRKAAGLT